MADETSWTPYGLEAIRARHIRRRRILAAILLAAAAIVILLTTSGGTTTKTQILDQNGNDVSADNQISINVPDNTPPKNGPVTVAISPGRVSLADTSQATQGTTVTHADVPAFGRAPALNWNYYLLLYGPWVLLGLAALALAKRRGKHDEVNYGVYKGSMPLEMISAQARDHIFTSRAAKTSIFAKRREDHLPREVLRVPQEDDA